jgi:uncharacterized protein
MRIVHWIALIIVIIGALNWGMVGFFNIDVISGIFGFGSIASLVIFAIIGVAGIWSFGFFTLFKHTPLKAAEKLQENKQYAEVQQVAKAYINTTGVDNQEVRSPHAFSRIKTEQ